MRVGRRSKKLSQDSRPKRDCDTVEVCKLAGNPTGFPYAVLRGAQVMGWLHSEADAQRLAWSMRLIDLLKNELGRAFVDAIFWRLRDYREKQ